LTFDSLLDHTHKVHSDNNSQSNMETDRYFNLQLTIQKLEEELSLYRNGTTGSELLDLIKEKDSELAVVKADLTKTIQELSTVKTNFGTLIKTSRKTLADNESLKTQHNLIQKEHTSMTNKYTEASTALIAMTEKLSSTESALQDTSEKLTIATQRNDEDCEMISKLQEQGIGYVKKLNCQYSKIKDDEKQLKMLEVYSDYASSSVYYFIISVFILLVNRLLINNRFSIMLRINSNAWKLILGKIKKKLLNYN
jgi:chromosome segregation ATPase